VRFIHVDGLHVKGIWRENPLRVQITGWLAMMRGQMVCLKRRHESLISASIVLEYDATVTRDLNQALIWREFRYSWFRDSSTRVWKQGRNESRLQLLVLKPSRSLVTW
jgi:hypothetical protein